MEELMQTAIEDQYVPIFCRQHQEIGYKEFLAGGTSVLVDRKRMWRTKYYKDRKKKEVTEKKAVNRVIKVKAAKKTPKEAPKVVKRSERSK
jgi:hypothetical protein